MRFAWIILMVGLALTAGGAQLDRQSRRTAILAPVVPPMFKSYAQYRQVMAQVRTAEPREALKMAQLLVQRRPIPSEHLSLLAMAMGRNGETEKAFVLYQKAAQRGWRDSIAQQTRLRIAVEVGDMAEASRRIAALWGIRETQMHLADATAKVLETSDGRKAMAATMSANGRWIGAFLAESDAVPPQHLAETIAMAAAQGARLNCTVLQRFETVYTQRKLPVQAAQIAKARQTCSR